MKAKTINYYSDELNDEFSGITRDTIQVDDTYQYIHKSILWKIASFIIYRIIMTPVAYLYLKCKFHLKVVNRKVLKVGKKQGMFLYGNHTQVPGDGYIPTVLTFPKRDYVVVNADNISMKGTKTFMEMIGAYPVPNKLGGMKNFVKGLKYHAEHKLGIVIYPEAHIWPYYTGIRPFTAESFAYPVMFSQPVYCFTVTYQKKKHSDSPKMTVFVDGPFTAPDGLKTKEAQKEIRDQVYKTMVQRSSASDYEYVTYQRKEEACG